MGKIALVSGLRGFIGGHLKAELEKQKIQVVGIPHDMFYTYEDSLPALLEKYPPDYIFHLASYGNLYNQTDDDETFYANTYATYKLIQATRHISYTAFINISTSSVTLPYQTLYAATKKASEAIAHALAVKYDKPIITIRPYSIYGEDEQETHLIPRIFRSCLFGEPLHLAPDPKHDFVYVKDFVKAIITIALQGSEWATDTIQIGTGINHSNGAVLRLIEQITGRLANIVGEEKPRDYDTQDWKADAKKGQVFFTHTPLKEGLQKVYESYKL